MTEEDWLNAVADKDPFKHLCLDVYIEDDKQFIQIVPISYVIFKI